MLFTSSVTKRQVQSGQHGFQDKQKYFMENEKIQIPHITTNSLIKGQKFVV